METINEPIGPLSKDRISHSDSENGGSKFSKRWQQKLLPHDAKPQKKDRP